MRDFLRTIFAVITFPLAALCSLCGMCCWYVCISCLLTFGAEDPIYNPRRPRQPPPPPPVMPPIMEKMDARTHPNWISKEKRAVLDSFYTDGVFEIVVLRGSE